MLDCARLIWINKTRNGKMLMTRARIGKTRVSKTKTRRTHLSVFMCIPGALRSLLRIFKKSSYVSYLSEWTVNQVKTIFLSLYSIVKTTILSLVLLSIFFYCLSPVSQGVTLGACTFTCPFHTLRRAQFPFVNNVKNAP